MEDDGRRRELAAEREALLERMREVAALDTDAYPPERIIELLHLLHVAAQCVMAEEVKAWEAEKEQRAKEDLPVTYRASVIYNDWESGEKP